MKDDRAALVRSLEAERNRRALPPPSVEELLQVLVGTLHSLWKTPADAVDNRAGLIGEHDDDGTREKGIH